MATIKAVKPGTARWKVLVADGIAKDATRNWFLGDAALEIAPMGPDGAHNGSADNLEQFADEVGVASGSMRIYRDVAAAWSPPTRVGGTCWKVHQMLASQQHLIKPGMTVTGAHKALGQSVAGRTGPESSPRQRAEQVQNAMADPEVRAELRHLREDNPEAAALAVVQVREAFEDPEVANEVMSDIHTRAQVHKATARAYDGEKVRARAHQDADPLLSRIDRFIAITKLMEVVYGLDRRVRDLPAVSEVSDEQRDELGRGAQLLAGYASALREYLATPTVDWDEALRRVNDDA